MKSTPSSLLRSLPMLAALIVGVWSAVGFRWVSDDAFISFRYAEQLVDGHGLVFNVGEQVEGYTNFSWTLMVAVAMWLGLDPVSFTWGLGIACYLGCIGVLWRTSFRIARDQGRTQPLLPLAAMAWAFHHHAQVFATSGLETPLFVLLVTAVVIACVEAQTSRGWLVVGLLGTAACLTRPDGGLYYGLAFFAVLMRRGGDWRGVAALLLPGLGFGLPYLAWKLHWFGELLPNTYYAKAGAGPRWEEGWAYIAMYVRMYWVCLLGVAAGGVLWLRGRGSTPWSTPRAGAILLVTILTTAAYVGRVGGDFMFARFLLPVTPIIFLALEAAVCRWEPERVRQGVALAALIGVGFAPYPPGILGTEHDDDGHVGVVEERGWYPPEWVQESRRQGAVLSRMFEGTDARVAFHGTQAMLMYYGQVPYALEAHVGLTDHEIARLPPPDVERVGHGVKADLALLRRRGIDLRLNFRLEQPITPLTKIDLGQGVTGRILTYRNEVMEVLRSRGASFVHFPSFLDAYISQLNAMDDAKVKKEYGSFRTYYFLHNEDRKRQQAFEDRLAESGP